MMGCQPGTVLLLLALLTAMFSAEAAFVDNLVALPPEIASKVPARLVQSQDELALCYIDPTATRCVLRGRRAWSFRPAHEP